MDRLVFTATSCGLTAIVPVFLKRPLISFGFIIYCDCVLTAVQHHTEPTDYLTNIIGNCYLLSRHNCFAVGENFEDIRDVVLGLLGPCMLIGTMFEFWFLAFASRTEAS